MDTGQMYLSIRGRISRKPYWLAILPLIVCYAVADVMTESTDKGIAGLGYLTMIILIWPSLAVQIKRWHDRDKSGWWQLISLIPIVGPLWVFIELGFLQGTPGANSYGLPVGTRPSDDYLARLSDAQDAYIGDPLRRTPTVTDIGSVKNAWRGT